MSINKKRTWATGKRPECKTCGNTEENNFYVTQRSECKVCKLKRQKEIWPTKREKKNK